MIQRSFKIKHANETAGAFVILAVVLLIGGFFAAARSQGWFEGKFTLRMKFDTDEGSYGLQEGSEVRIKNIVAGRVGKMVPNAEGGLETTLEIQNRFRAFVHEDSVAKVKMKFGVGDAFIEIGMGGKGPLVEDGAFIKCQKDDDVMETARKFLDDARATLIPMLENVKGILEHVNGISRNVDTGEGLAGSVLNDKELAANVKQTIVNVNSAFEEAGRTLRETTRLVKGMQKHWLVRKYIGEDGKEVAALPIPSYMSSYELAHSADEYREELAQSRRSDDADGIVQNACGLGFCLVGEGRTDAAGTIAQEARVEAGQNAERLINVRLLESELTRAAGKADAAAQAARDAVALLKRASPRALRVRCLVALADAYCDLGKADEAEEALDDIGSHLKKSPDEVKAVAAGAAGRLALLQGHPERAGSEFDKETSFAKESAMYYGMAGSLDRAGGAYEKAGKTDVAADRYFRAGRSLLSSGHTDEARACLEKASRMCDKAGLEPLMQQIRALQQQIKAGEKDAASAQPPVS